MSEVRCEVRNLITMMSTMAVIIFIFSGSAPNFTFYKHRQSFFTAKRSKQDRWLPFQAQITSFSAGKITVDENNTPNWSVPRIVDLECFQEMDISFYGDSRIRYIFSEFVKIGNDSVLEDLTFPRNSECPYETNLQCSHWFRGKGSHWEFINGVSLTFEWQSDSVSELSYHVLSPNTDVLIFSVGAWDMFNHKDDGGFEASNVLKLMNKISIFFKHSIKIWIWYPECGDHYREERSALRMNVKRFVDERNDWVLFDIPTPNGRFCEGFHVRFEWAKVEAEVIINALCNVW